MKTYLYIAAILFGLVALAHLVRIALGWPVTVGPSNAPMWVSWLGVIVTGGLSVWGFRLAASA